jgi:hypothetical protein
LSTATISPSSSTGLEEAAKRASLHDAETARLSLPLRE